ncbi:MAG: NUDIX domain-containing protein [Pseudomonadota bacterium]
MKHRIAAGALVEQEGKILLVRHHRPAVFDFWVAPGGGAEGSEDLCATVRREVREECGLEVEPQTLAYIEEFTSPHTRECKLWFTARLVGGAIDTAAIEASREGIVEAAFLAPSEFAGKIVFPPVLHNAYWTDKTTGFAFPKYLGVRELQFY